MSKYVVCVWCDKLVKEHYVDEFCSKKCREEAHNHCVNYETKMKWFVCIAGVALLVLILILRNMDVMMK